MTQQFERQAKPLSLKIVMAFVLFQVVTNAVLGVFLVYLGIEDAEHGKEVPTLQYVLSYGSIVIALILLMCVVLLTRAVAAARPVIATIEVIGMLNGLITLVQGIPQSIVGVALPLLVLIHLYRADLTTWLEDQHES